MWSNGPVGDITPINAWPANFREDRDATKGRTWSINDRRDWITVLKDFKSKDIGKKSENSNSLKGLLPVLGVARIVGVLPLGISNKYIRFQYISFSMLQWCFIFTLQSVYVLIFLISIFKEGSAVNWVTLCQTAIFDILGVSGIIFLFHVAKRLPTLMNRFTDAEKKIEDDFIPKYNRKILLLTIILLSSAIGETIASMFYSIPNNMIGNYWRYLEYYVMRGNQSVADLIGYSKFLGLIILIINKIATFVWNYLDLLISATALTLTAIVRGLNAKIEIACSLTNKGKEVDWVWLHHLHIQIFDLSAEVDKVFGNLVLQSYATNLFFIILQVYNGLTNATKVSSGAVKDEGNPVLNNIYLTWSFLHLASRLLLVSICCLRYHHASLETLSSVYAIENNSYEKDIKRLVHQMEKLKFGFTGSGFLLIDKNFLLTIAGVLLTYEIMLIQFSPSSR